MYVNTQNSERPGDGTYKNVIASIQKDGVCPFCPEQLAKYHKNPILREGKYWALTDNMYPYKGAAHHLLFVHKAHITGVDEITPEAWVEFHDFIKEIIGGRGIAGGTFFMRFGDTKYTGASVSHLHAQLISSNPDATDYAPITARVG